MATYILPGMGIDSSMYGVAFKKLAAVKFVDWPVYCNEHTISELAARVVEINTIQNHDIVGGSSLGGIVAAEISRQIHLKKIILIGSTLSPDNINPILKKLSTLSEVTPVKLIQSFAGKINSMAENRLFQMFSRADPLHIRSMCTAVFEWEGNQDPDCPVAHIHGKKDKVIFPPAHGAQVIENGGHLLAMTHEQRVADFIYENMT